MFGDDLEEIGDKDKEPISIDGQAAQADGPLSSDKTQEVKDFEQAE